MGKYPLKRYLLLAAWLAAILFPMAWLGRFSDRYKHIFEAIFSPVWMHWLMHSLLFAGLTILVMWVFKLEAALNRATLRVAGFMLLVSLGVGVLQEALQLVSTRQPLRWDSLLDLGVDGLGTLGGTLLFWGWKRLRINCHKMPWNNDGG